jgi:hypothetical protein
MPGLTLPKFVVDSSPGSVLPKEEVRVGSGNGPGTTWEREWFPDWMEQMLNGVLAYRGRWVYCGQRGAATGRERRLMHLGGRTESEDPRGRTDGSPPGGM